MNKFTLKLAVLTVAALASSAAMAMRSIPDAVEVKNATDELVALFPTKDRNVFTQAIIDAFNTGGKTVEQARELVRENTVKADADAAASAAAASAAEVLRKAALDEAARKAAADDAARKAAGGTRGKACACTDALKRAGNWTLDTVVKSPYRSAKAHPYRAAVVGVVGATALYVVYQNFFAGKKKPALKPRVRPAVTTVNPA